MGYLRCKACGGCYELQDGESPGDFESCQCGGALEYFKKIPKTKDSPQIEKKSILNRWHKQNSSTKAIILIGVLFLGLIVVGSVFFIATLYTGANDISLDSSFATNTSTLTGKELESYKTSCKEVDVKELIYNPDKYKGQHVKFTGVTYQVMDVNMLAERNEEDADTIFIGPTTNIENPVENPIFVIYKNASSIEQLNIVTVYGDVVGVYNRGIAPALRINARYVEKLKNREEVMNSQYSHG